MKTKRKKKTASQRVKGKSGKLPSKAPPGPAAALARSKRRRPPPLSEGALRTIRRLGTPSGLSRAARKRLRRQWRPRLAAELRARGVDPSELGLRTHGEVADVLLLLTERVGYGRYGRTELLRKRRGLRGVFNGEAFELVVQRHARLHADLLGIARDELKYLREGLRATGKTSIRVVNARNKRIRLKGALSDPVRVLDIRIRRPDGKVVKFMDAGYTTFITEGGKLYASFLVGAEKKLPRAAREMSEQVSRQAGRFAGASEVIMRVGNRDVTIPAERLLFNERGTVRVGILPSQSGRLTWRTTEKGGYVETYLRIGVKVDMTALTGVTSLLFP